ncbi:MAG: hypothetical protein OXG69_14765 [bacterium]|nr:hypothetical protein [bacterium]
MPRARKRTQPAEAPPSEEYGQADRIEQGMRAVPLPGEAGQGQTVNPLASQRAAPSAPPAAGTLGTFGRGSDRPGEDIMTMLRPGSVNAPPLMQDRTRSQLMHKLPFYEAMAANPYLSDGTRALASRVAGWIRG